MNDRQSRIDPEFTALPLRELADAALAQARSLGAQHADFRAERIRGQQIGLSDGNPQTLFDADDTGLAVRVIVDGTWGFASAVDLTADAAAQAARQAVEVAQVAAAMNTEPIELAPEPAYGEVTWVSAYDVDPFTISVADKVALLAQWSHELLAHPAVSHVDASLQQVRECKFYSDGATTATQQRVRLHPQVTAVAISDDGRFDTMRTLAPPVGRGYEFLTGRGWDFAAELAELPDLLAAKMHGPVGRAGPLRPGHRPVQPLAHHPRVDRARHRARPGAGLRGRLRRHVVRHPGQARPPAVRVRRHARHRRPHRRARPGHHRLRRRGRGRAVLGPDQRRRPDRLPARPADGAAQGLRAVERVRVRRLARPHAAAADGERVAAAGPAARPPRT